MPNEIEEFRNKIRNEADQLKAERAARQRRHEILSAAAHIAGGMMASPLGAKAPLSGIAEAAVRIAGLVVDEVDRASSPIVQLEAVMPTIGGAQ